MDMLLMCGLAFAMGFVVKLLFTRMGRFDSFVYSNLFAGKTVTIAVDTTAYIFEMKDKRIIVSQATAQMLPPVERSLNELSTLALVDSNSNQLVDGTSSGSESEIGNG